MIRVALTALSIVVATGAAAEPWAWSDERPAAAIGGRPWGATEDSAAFGADDAFVFDDVPRAVHIGDEALAVALRIDRDRMQGVDQPGAGDTLAGIGGDGRVDAAFGRFVAFGPDGRAYASLELARGEAGQTRIAQGPTPSLVAMLLPAR